MQYAKISLFPYILALVIMVGCIYYGVTNYQELSTYKKEIATNTNLTLDLEEQISAIDSEHAAADSEANATAAEREDAMNDIFPSAEEMTNLTREFDAFFIKYNASNEPFFLSNLSFDKPITEEDSDFSVLPFQMTIKSSEDNFYRFLEYMENSGSFENQIRLMSIDQVSINFENTMGQSQTSSDEISTDQPQEEVAPIKMINYSVKGAAYFQKEIKTENQ